MKSLFCCALIVALTCPGSPVGAQDLGANTLPSRGLTSLSGSALSEMPRQQSGPTPRSNGLQVDSMLRQLPVVRPSATGQRRMTMRKALLLTAAMIGGLYVVVYLVVPK
jgi:hypothetical protein